MTDETRLRQWRVRRRMAILAFFTGLYGFPILYIFFPVLSAIAAHFYALVGLVLGAYYGLTTYHDVKDTKQD